MPKATVAGHYKNLLAQHYSWMFGVPFGDKVAEQKKWIAEAMGPQSEPKGLALDLGSGPGFQSVALAELGYGPVIAIDSSAELLQELDSRRGPYAIETRLGDLTQLRADPDTRPAAVAVCMGDTLTHLPSKDAVRTLFRDVAARLLPGGALVLTYRDLTQALEDTDRFFLVRADAERILTCFLDYDAEDSVLVTDLVHSLGADGWTLAKSSYRKLRLSQDWLRAALTEAGFTSQTHGLAGRMSLVVARI